LFIQTSIVRQFTLDAFRGRFDLVGRSHIDWHRQRETASLPDGSSRGLQAFHASRQEPDLRPVFGKFPDCCPDNNRPRRL
jgi:hypothetical protein